MSGSVDLLHALQAERYVLWAGLEEAGLPALGAVLFQCELVLDQGGPLARVDQRGTIRIRPDRAAVLSPGQVRWVLLHEAIHASLEHPRRFARLGARARQQLQAIARAAAEGRGPVGIAGMDEETAAAWVRAWAAALEVQGGTWKDWEAEVLQRFANGLQILGDLLVHAWMEMIARMARPGLLVPLEDLIRPEQEEIPTLLQASLEELAMRLLEAAIAAPPSPNRGEDSEENEVPSIRSARDLLEALRSGAPIPLPEIPGLAGGSLPGAEGTAEGEGGDTESSSLPGWAREVLTRACGHGLLPGNLVEQLAPGATGIPSLEAELEGFLHEIRRKGETQPCWRRLNRRAGELEVALPARASSQGLLVAIVRDTSGSMAREVLERIALAILATEGMAGILAADADAQVQGGVLCLPPGGLELPPEALEALREKIPGFQELDRAGLAEWLARARGRGGTDFRPATALIRDLREARVPLGGVLYLTDGEGKFPRPDDEPDIPVRWVMPRRMEVPFGEVIVRPDLFQKNPGGGG